MAERDQQVYPFAPHANGHTKSDEESGPAAAAEREARKKKRMKCLTYVAAFAVFQTGVILIFALVVMKARTPKFQIRTANVQTFDVVSNPTNPSFNIRMDARVRVKNTNFGPYKYQNSTIAFFYRGEPVGQVSSPRGKAGFRSSKSFLVSVDLTSNNVRNTAQLASDLASGAITLTGQSRLEGKAELMWFMYKKKKATNMACTIEIGTDRAIRSLSCQ